MIEQIEKRTRNSKTFQDEANPQKFTWEGSVGSVHYQEDGQWKDIDNTFEPALAPWDWQMLKAGYHIRVKEDFTVGQIIEFEKQGETFQFQPMALEWTNDLDQIQLISMPQLVTPAITNPEVGLLPVSTPSHQGTIRWDNAYGEGIGFEWKCIPTRLVKILEIENLNKLPALEQYILDGGSPVLRLNLIFDPPSGVDIYVDGELWDRSSKKQTFDVIEFRKDGEVLWGFMPLRYWGSSPGLEENTGQSVATLEKRGNKLYISIRIPYEWLQNAIYPVFIDADVEEQVGHGLDDAYEWQPTGGMDTTGDFLYIADAVDGAIAGTRFQTVAIPNSATIDVAYAKIHAEYNQSNSKNGRVRAEAIDDAPAFTTDNSDITNRSFTSGSTTAWTGQTACNDYDTGSIVDEIQAVVNRGGWATGQDIVLAFDSVDSGSGGYASAFESVNTPVRLYVDFTAAAAGPAGVKTLEDLAIASVKTINDCAIASVKTINDSAA